MKLAPPQAKVKLVETAEKLSKNHSKGAVSSAAPFSSEPSIPPDRLSKDHARECKTEEELAELAENNNMELSLDELDEAAGGYGEKSLGMKPCRVFYGTRDPYYISSRYDDRCPRKDHRVW